ncbi:ATP-binding cassette domain-containing protein [Jannaschia sp. CCS1]|uniref:ATP-binding cassette domain-containing protein n=1 Tax=Jannaschia sp. (strain CCS1) TaxID=290400 RepID=UPI00031D7DA8|nr:ATP-binding cassette domain-containing protein [Jannaschia sp. CCS1]
MLLDLRSVTKRFGGTVALDHVDGDVQAREGLCLIGENGSGKPPLIKIIPGVHGLDGGGEIHLDGEKLRKLDPNLSRSLGIEVIFQDLSPVPNLSVYENIAPVFPRPKSLFADQQGADADDGSGGP